MASLLAVFAHETGLAAPALSEQALRQLERLALPGNVRELENLLHRALALSAGGDLQLDELDLRVQRAGAEPVGAEAAIGIAAAKVA